MNSKRLIALFLLTLISFKILVVPFVYLDFELRKEYIIKNLCENRFKPQLHCDGKCYLAKSLTKIAEEKAQNAAEKQGQNIKKVLEESFDEQLLISPTLFTQISKVTSSFTYQFNLTADFVSSLLHPPAFVLS